MITIYAARVLHETLAIQLLLMFNYESVYVYGPEWVQCDLYCQPLLLEWRDGLSIEHHQSVR